MEFPKGDSNAATGEYDGEYELVLEEVEEEVEEEIEEDELGGGSSSGGGEGKGDRVGVGRGESPRKMYNVDNGGDELKQTDASSSSAGKIFVGGVAWETTEGVGVDDNKVKGASTVEEAKEGGSSLAWRRWLCGVCKGDGECVHGDDDFDLDIANRASDEMRLSRRDPNLVPNFAKLSSLVEERTKLRRRRSGRSAFSWWPNIVQLLRSVVISLISTVHVEEVNSCFVPDQRHKFSLISLFGRSARNNLKRLESSSLASLSSSMIQLD